MEEQLVIAMRLIEADMAMGVDQARHHRVAGGIDVAARVRGRPCESLVADGPDSAVKRNRRNPAATGHGIEHQTISDKDALHFITPRRLSHPDLYRYR
jgi:hypothetical protein